MEVPSNFALAERLALDHEEDFTKWLAVGHLRLVKGS
jgi:hypothetical protein